VREVVVAHTELYLIAGIYTSTNEMSSTAVIKLVIFVLVPLVLAGGATPTVWRTAF